MNLLLIQAQTMIEGMCDGRQLPIKIFPMWVINFIRSAIRGKIGTSLIFSNAPLNIINRSLKILYFTFSANLKYLQIQHFLHIIYLMPICHNIILIK